MKRGESNRKASGKCNGSLPYPKSHFRELRNRHPPVFPRYTLNPKPVIPIDSRPATLRGLRLHKHVVGCRHLGHPGDQAGGAATRFQAGEGLG